MTETDTTGAPPVDFLPDGTIRFRLSKTYRLRRPKLKEYRRLREDFYAANDEIVASADGYRDEGDEVDATIRALTFTTTGEGEVARKRSDMSGPERDELRALRRRGRDLLDTMVDRHGEIRFEFFAAVVTLLSLDGELLEDDHEAWMAGGDLLVDLFAHWMAVPLGRGPGGK